tara:strand:- start:289 stop:750 length:462 start_codon:yes stop_codon:yes gene_type:complete
VLALVAGISVFLVFLLGRTSFAEQVELITFTPYSQKVFLFTLLTLGLIGNYVSIYKLWKSPHSKSIGVFAISYSVILVITSISLLLWLSDMEALLDTSFKKLKFPNDVDQVIYNLRSSFLRSIYWIFLFLGTIGLISFFGILVLQKSLFKRFF